MFDAEIFGNNMRQLRKARGLTESQLAIQVDVQYTQYCRVENGTEPPTAKLAVSIANYFGVGLNHLLSIPCTGHDQSVLKIQSLLGQIEDPEETEFLFNTLLAVMKAVK